MANVQKVSAATNRKPIIKTNSGQTDCKIQTVAVNIGMI